MDSSAEHAALLDLNDRLPTVRQSRRIVGVASRARHPRTGAGLSAVVRVRPALVGVRFADPALIAETGLLPFRSRSLMVGPSSFIRLEFSVVVVAGLRNENEIVGALKLRNVPSRVPVEMATAK